jgi:hypothetical protein
MPFPTNKESEPHYGYPDLLDRKSTRKLSGGKKRDML